MRRDETLSKDILIPVGNSSRLKGLLAVFVLIHHLYQHMEVAKDTFAGRVLQSMGFLAVGMFLFLSGYGLYSAYKVKGKSYIDWLPKSKILPLYIINLFLVILYLFKAIIFDETINPVEVFQSFFFGGTIVAKGWYIQVQLLLYIIFWYVLKKIKNIYTQFIIILLACTLFVLLCILIDLPSYWFLGIFCFPLGMLFSIKEK